MDAFNSLELVSIETDLFQLLACKVTVTCASKWRPLMSTLLT